MNNKVFDTTQKYQMISVGDAIVLGLSGGADSVALLHILCSIRKRMQLSLIACHINHGLRGKESERDQHFVKELCDSWKVKLHVLETQVDRLAKERRLSEEECGRQVRYSFFRECCPTGGKIATAHHLDDNIETILFHVARGTGPAGFIGIQPVRENIIRPLLFCTRKEIEQYCKENNLSYVVDSTNLSDKYSRNHLRIHVVPELKKIAPRLEQNVMRLSNLVKQDEDYFTKQVSHFLEQNRKGEGVFIEAFKKEHPAIQSRVIIHLLKEKGIPYEQKRVELLLCALKKTETIQLSKDYFFSVKKGYFQITKNEQPVNPFKMPLKFGKMALQTGNVVHIKVIECSDYENLKKININMPRNCLDYDKIIGKVAVRQRQEGDRIRLWNRKITKNLKKLFNEAKLPPKDRASRVILQDEAGVIFVEGFGCDERVMVDKTTKHVLVVERCRDEIAFSG